MTQCAAKLLYTKLISVNFGGKVVSLIRSMYYNVTIRVSLTHDLSAPRGKARVLFIPLLFALLVCMFCKDMKVTLATSKTYIISNATYDVNWAVNSKTIEEILVAK